MSRRLPAAVAVVVLAGTNGCSGGGSTAAPPAPAVPPAPSTVTAPTSTYTGPTAQATISFGTPAASSGRAPSFVSPNASALKATAVVNGQTLETTAPIAAGASSVKVDVPLGSVKLTITLLDKNAAPLAVGTTTATIVPNSANAIVLPLAGIPAAIVFDVATTAFTRGTAAASLGTLTALDASGAPIGGTAPYAVPIALSIVGGPSFTVSPASIAAPGVSFTLSYDGGNGATATLLGDSVAVAGGKPGSGNISLTIAVPTASPDVLSVSPSSLSLNVGATDMLPIQISEFGTTAGSIALVATCPSGASISLSLATVPTNATTTVAVTAITAPLATVSPACTILLTSVSGQTATVNVDVRQIQLQIQSRGRALERRR